MRVCHYHQTGSVYMSVVHKNMPYDGVQVYATMQVCAQMHVSQHECTDIHVAYGYLQNCVIASVAEWAWTRILAKGYILLHDYMTR